MELVKLPLSSIRISAALALATGSLLSTAAVSAQRVDLGSGSIVETVKGLRAGEFVWTPEIAPQGPTLLIVNLKTQRATLYRNGVPIGASTVSTGRPGYDTPTGVFTILQKHVEHYSSKYDNAPMPYMQRLTWYGIALHAGNLPGYPASHGCIRLPPGFAKLLYEETRLGMTVVIMDEETSPRLASPPVIAQPFSAEKVADDGAVVWQPDRSLKGPVSIVVSVADGRAIVLRNGVEIGSGPVTVGGPVAGGWAYALRSVDSAGQHWIRIPLSARGIEKGKVPREEWERFSAPASLRRAVASVVEPGTTIVVVPDSLKKGATGTGLTVIEGEPTENP